MTPTYDTTSQFDRAFERLTQAEQLAFKKTLAQFITDLRKREGFRKSLRVKRYQGHEGLFELTWAPDGRALFAYGTEVIKGEAHIIWINVGGHEIFKRGKP